jgi:hypothetical protein
MELSLCRVCTCLPLQVDSLFSQLCFLLLSVLWQKLTSFINLWHCTNLHPLLGSWWSKWQCYGSWSQPHMLLLNISEDACDFSYHSCCCWRCMKIVSDCNIHVAVEALRRSEDACDCTTYVVAVEGLPRFVWLCPSILLLNVSEGVHDCTIHVAAVEDLQRCLCFVPYMLLLKVSEDCGWLSLLYKLLAPHCFLGSGLSSNSCFADMLLDLNYYKLVIWVMSRSSFQVDFNCKYGEILSTCEDYVSKLSTIYAFKLFLQRLDLRNQQFAMRLISWLDNTPITLFSFFFFLGSGPGRKGADAKEVCISSLPLLSFFLQVILHQEDEVK